jgi:hypothetical protein
MGLRARSFVILNRLMEGVDRMLTRAQRIVRELPLVFYEPRAAELATFDYFERMPRYREPLDQRAGLYPFESRAVKEFFPTAPARVLAHGVGGGREVLALVEAGYQVEAYEPAAKLALVAAELLAGRATVGELGLQGWARARTATRFDAVFTGWSVWGYLVQQSDRLEVLRAFRGACPEGPVLLSFFREDAFYDVGERTVEPRPLHPTWTDRLERLARTKLRERWLGAPPLERGTVWHNGLYLHLTEEWELRQEAALAGYRVAHYEPSPLRFSNAVLIPVDIA